jgi:hypothetical protein
VDGTTHLVYEPLDFSAKLAALIPRPLELMRRAFGYDLLACPNCGGKMVIELRAAARCNREDPDSGATCTLNISARRRGHPSEVKARWMGLRCLRRAVLPAHRLMRSAPREMGGLGGVGEGVSDVVRFEYGTLW